ncbi:MAG: tRNA pseudouridine(55) synthase TruB [Candidatus Dormibacteria bacterium]
MTSAEVAPPPIRAPVRHDLHGVVPLNKPAGMTSFQAVKEVRRALGVKRAGHAGTLDPTATGLLPICVGQATRLVDFFHLQPKTYHCVVRLGLRSDTLDLEGTITAGGDASAIDADAARSALEAFVGEILQVPPMHSAVRHEGRRLYELARSGEQVEREARPVTIHSAELVELRPGAVAEAELLVVSGKGAYMRVIAADLGDALGCGGLLSWLERTEYGPLSLSHSVTVEELCSLEDPAAAMLPPEQAVAFLTPLHLPPQLAVRVRQGQSVWLAGPAQVRSAGGCRAHDHTGRLIAVGELTGNLFRPTKVMAY